MATSVNTPDKITYFAETDYRSKRIKFGIRDEDRERHMYIIGKTGMGKSTLLENLAIQDIQNGEGLCFIDPHGGTAETLLSYVPEHRLKDVIYFAPFDQEFPVGLNVMEDMGRDKRPLISSGLMGAFKKVWVDAWSARMEYILSNAMLALMETPGSTLLGVNRIFADKSYRNLIVNNVTDPSVKAFWVDEYAKYSDKFATEATAAIQNKVGQFAANPLIRNMVGQSVSSFDIRKVMDERKILLVNLSKGRMGEGNANLVGSMLITKIYLAAMSRADVGAEVVKGLPSFYLYVDEFQSFANESFADILSEARKYKLSLTIAHQYIEQMSDEVRAAVFGNVGSMVSFRVGAYDAEVLEKEFAPAFTAEDMVNLGARQIYLKLMINGVGSSPFSATTLNRPPFPTRAYTNEVIAMSRAQFARPRAEVEAEIKKWHEPIPEQPRDPNAPDIPETRKYPPGMRPVRPVGASASYTGVIAPPPQPPAAPVAVVPPPASRAATPMRELPRTEVAPVSQREIVAPTPLSVPMVTPPRPTPQVLVEATPEPVLPTPETRVQAPEHTPPTRQTEGGGVHQPFRDELKKLPFPQDTTQNKQREQGKNSFSSANIPRPTQQPPLTSVQKNEPPTPPTSSARPMPLAHLKSQQKSDKGPSTQNLSSLKELINAAFAGSPTERSGATPAPQTPPSLPQETPKQEISTPKVAVVAPPPAPVPPSLLGDVPSLQYPKEVPEDVLRSVLAE